MQKSNNVQQMLMQAAAHIFPGIPTPVLAQYVQMIMQKYPDYSVEQWHQFAQQMNYMVKSGKFQQVVAKAKMRNNATKHLNPQAQQQPMSGQVPQAPVAPQTPGVK